MLEKKEFCNLMWTLADVFRFELSKRALNAYWALTRNHHPLAFRRAIRKAISEGDRFPTPKELLRLIRGQIRALKWGAYLKSLPPTERPTPAALCEDSGAPPPIRREGMPRCELMKP